MAECRVWLHLSATQKRNGQAPIAQSAERLHGKEKVNGSIPFGGSSLTQGLTGYSVGAFAVGFSMWVFLRHTWEHLT